MAQQQEVEHLQVDDIGTVFRMVIRDEVEAPVDLSLATKQIMKVWKPSGVSDIYFATIDDAAGGIIKYVFTTSDLDEPDALYEAQAYIESPDWTGHSNIKVFYVEHNIPWPSRNSSLNAYLLGA
jgi:hypothetical protein